MRKLISANLMRLWLNKAFWVTVLLMIGLESAFCLLLLKQNSTRLDIVMYTMVQIIGILISVFLSLFMGTEYNDGTLRNKLIVGHKRSSVYLASLIAGIAAVTVIYLAWALTGGMFAVIIQALPTDLTIEISYSGIVGWLACVSYVAIFNLIGMLSSNKARTSIGCVLTAFMLMFAGLTCYSIARPGFLPASKRAVFQFLFEMNPFGQTFQLMTIDMAMMWKLSAYSLILSAVLSGIGIYVFNKKDLK